MNKGDDPRKNCRSRLVGKEFNNGAMDGLFAGTPPLEALRYLMHRATTTDDRTRAEDKVVMINDVARAFLEAKLQRDVCVELPPEAMTAEDRNKDLRSRKAEIFIVRTARETQQPIGKRKWQRRY